MQSFNVLFFGAKTEKQFGKTNSFCFCLNATNIKNNILIHPKRNWQTYEETAIGECTCDLQLWLSQLFNCFYHLSTYDTHQYIVHYVKLLNFIKQNSHRV